MPSADDFMDEGWEGDELLSAFYQRVAAMREFVDAIFERGDIFEEMIASVVADGWPEAMVRAGFRRHQTTWRVDMLCRGLAQEAAQIGGISKLFHGARHRMSALPARVSHIWPALPGAGLTPVLYGALLGIEQSIRPSRRGVHFAKFVHHFWPQALPEIELILPENLRPLGSRQQSNAWADADVIIVSGSDETIEEVRRIARAFKRSSAMIRSGADDLDVGDLKSDLGENRATETDHSPRVIGYGHRVSFCVVVDDLGADLDKIAQNIAQDTVLWHQAGCFSPRGVLFCGETARMNVFGAALGQEIAREEELLDAREVGAAELARRAQMRGVAEFTTQIWGDVGGRSDGVGWVQYSPEPFRGAQISAHTLSLHIVDSPESLGAALDLPAHQVQGVALQAPGDVYEKWADALRQAGATRICAPGELQAPPADWPHDGRPNILPWLV